SGVVRDVVLWGRLRVMQDVMVSDIGGDIRDQLAGLRDASPLVSELLVADRSGKVLASTQSDQVGISVGKEPMFLHALDGGVYQGGAETQPPVGGRRALAFAAPIPASYDQTTVVGAIVVFVEWQKLSDLLSTITIAGEPQSPRVVLALLATRAAQD